LRRRDAAPGAADRLRRPPREGRLRAERRRAGGGRGGERREERPRDGEILRRRPAPRAALCLLAGLLIAGAPLPAADTPDDEKPLDARTFAQGIDAVRQGRRDEGLRLLKKL